MEVGSTDLWVVVQTNRYEDETIADKTFAVTAPPDDGGATLTWGSEADAEDWAENQALNTTAPAGVSSRSWDIMPEIEWLDAAEK